MLRTNVRQQLRAIGHAVAALVHQPLELLLSLERRLLNHVAAPLVVQVVGGHIRELVDGQALVAVRVELLQQIVDQTEEVRGARLCSTGKWTRFDGNCDKKINGKISEIGSNPGYPKLPVDNDYPRRALQHIAPLLLAEQNDSGRQMCQQMKNNQINANRCQTWVTECQKLVQRQAEHVAAGRLVPQRFVSHEQLLRASVQPLVVLRVGALNEIVVIAERFQKVRIVFVPRDEAVARGPVDFREQQRIIANGRLDVAADALIDQFGQLLYR